MKIVTQNNKRISVKGYVGIVGSNILFNDTLLGKYKTSQRAFEVFAELTCQSLNKFSEVYKMPVE